MYDGVVVPWEVGLSVSNALSLENKIGEGKHRKVYREGNLALKVLKSYVMQDFGLFHMPIPTKLFSLYKVGSLDFNRYEYESYLKLILQIPEEMRDSFAKVFEVAGNNGHSISISELVVNADETLSKTLEQHGGVKSLRFWDRIADFERLFLEKDVPYLDIRPENIAVKEFSGNESTPVFVDYDTFGRRAYLFRANFYFKSERQKRIKKRFSRIRKEYKID